MHLQFIRKFVSDIYLPYDNNVIVIRKNRRIKKSFEIFVKHTSLLPLVVILIKIILFPNRKKNHNKYISFQHY